jgi:hypothetical protein
MAEARVGGDVKAAFAFGMLLIVVAALVDVGAVGWLVAPIVIGSLGYAIARAPLRPSMLVLMFCAMTLENPSESPAQGLWHSPFYSVGALLLTHLNNMTGVRPLVFSGIDIFFVILIFTAVSRKLSRSKIDRGPPTPRPMIRLALLSLGGAAFAWMLGMLQGGEMRWALWQLEKVVYLPIVFLLFSAGIRGEKDHIAVAKVLLAAATVRACAAIYIWSTVVPPIDPMTGHAELEYATTHHDSMLFAIAFALLLSLILERAERKYIRLSLLLMPILFAGMIVNGRRMVWVQVAVVFLTLYLATPDNPFKKKARRVLLVLSPGIAAYVAAGWNRTTSGAFAPVQTIRSVVEPATDASSLWREMENYNIMFTMKQFPFIGTGYGHGFWEIIPLPVINYELERYLPHNSILALVCFTGYLGFTAITLMWAAGVYFSMRAYHAAVRPIDRTAALMGVGAVLIYLLQCWGDMGLGAWTGVFTVAPALAVGCKLAVATGAWPIKRKRPARAAETAPAEPAADGPFARPG